MPENASKAQSNTGNVADRSNNGVILAVVEALDSIAQQSIKNWKWRSHSTPEIVPLQGLRVDGKKVWKAVVH
jgi:hypothetical protein